MAKYPNFYETVAEANIRLRGTFVMYDGAPYQVLAVSNHKSDGIFRIYLEPLGAGESGMSAYSANPSPQNNFTSDDPALGKAMDTWLDKQGESTTIIRKMMNSPAFDKFRPFPLGNVNSNGSVLYLERHPQRRTEQGLTPSAVATAAVSAIPLTGLKMRSGIDWYGAPFRDCLMGKYPTAQLCLDNLLDVDVTNDAAAFHRMFAFARGPIDCLFLAYKADVVGIVPNGDLSVVKLGRDFRHVKEAVEALGIFNSVK